LALVVVSVLVLAAQGWGNIGFDGARNGNSPTETRITPDSARNLKVRWHVQLGGSTPPVAAGGQDGRVYAFDANGCGARTCSPPGSAATGSPVRWAPAISAGRVYVTNDNGDLYALGG
jgi:outer membrane protein assembly factor BamB